MTIKNPILLIPGFGGSKLMLQNRIIYPPELSDIICNRSAWIDNMIVKYDINKNEYKFNHLITTSPFGDKSAVELQTNIPFFDKKNIYNHLIKNHPSILPIPYDFRLIHIPNYMTQLYHNLTAYIESFGGTKMSIVTHSSGGLIAHYFLTQKTQEWKDKYITEIVYINVPFCGLTMPLIEMVDNTYMNRILSRDLIGSFGGVIMNLPNPDYIKPILLVDGIETDYIEYFKLSNIQRINANNVAFKRSFDANNGIKTTILYTSMKKTPAIIHVNSGRISKIIYGNGDGVVLLESILHPMIWCNDNIKYIHIPLNEHSNILYSDVLDDILLGLESGNT